MRNKMNIDVIVYNSLAIVFVMAVRHSKENEK